MTQCFHLDHKKHPHFKDVKWAKKSTLKPIKYHMSNAPEILLASRCVRPCTQDVPVSITALLAEDLTVRLWFPKNLAANLQCPTSEPHFISLSLSHDPGTSSPLCPQSCQRRLAWRNERGKRPVRPALHHSDLRHRLSETRKAQATDSSVTEDITHPFVFPSSSG